MTPKSRALYLTHGAAAAMAAVDDVSSFEIVRDQIANELGHPWPAWDRPDSAKALSLWCLAEAARILTEETMTESRPDFRKSIKRDGDMNERIKAGRFSVSVQASRAHYCAPRETLPDLMAYSSLELAVFDERGEWVTREDLSRLGVAAETVGRWEGGGSPVAGYVPVAEVQALIDLLASKGGVA